MTADNVIAVLGWCMVVNFGILAVWALSMIAAPNFVFRTQSLVTSISREDMDLAMYRLIGQFKLGVILFNLAPYIALRIVF